MTPPDADPPAADDQLGGSLRDLASRLESVEEVPLAERPALFEELHERLTAALDDLEEV